MLKKFVRSHSAVKTGSSSAVIFTIFEVVFTTSSDWLAPLGPFLPALGQLPKLVVGDIQSNSLRDIGPLCAGAACGWELRRVYRGVRPAL